MISRISVIIPCYNEQWRIPATLEEILVFMSKHPMLLSEIIVVDDGSKDATVERVFAMSEKFKGKLRIERLVQNSGKWAAIHHGMAVAKNDALLILDADGSASINELEKFDVRACLSKRTLIFGSRFMDGATINGKSISRSIVSRGYRAYVLFMYWFATGKHDVDDMQAPFKLVYKSRISRPMFVDRFAGDIELACALESKIRNHPLQFVHRAGSKVSVAASWNMFWETLRVVRFQRKFLKALRNGTLTMENNKIYKDN